MGKRDKNHLKKCPSCGTILNMEDRLKTIFRESEEAMTRYYNKLRKKK